MKALNGIRVLDLTQFELKPIGESLSFPHLLDGKANATLTVSGPLNHLQLAGHVEGTTLTGDLTGSATIISTMGNCVTTPVTQATFVQTVHVT